MGHFKSASQLNFAQGKEVENVSQADRQTDRQTEGKLHNLATSTEKEISRDVVAKPIQADICKRNERWQRKVNQSVKAFL